MRSINNSVGKPVLTTGQISRFLGVSPRTVGKWYDSGLLRGYRLPGGRDRRFDVQEVLEFVEKNNITCRLRSHLSKTLIFCGVIESARTRQLVSLLSEWRVVYVNSLFSVGREASISGCGIVVADMSYCSRVGLLEAVKDKCLGWSWIVLLPDDDNRSDDFNEAGVLLSLLDTEWSSERLSSVISSWVNGYV